MGGRHHLYPHLRRLAVLAVVLVLFPRQVVGWSIQARMDRELALNALLMAVWRRQPQETVMVHSDQGSQFSSYDWKEFLKVQIRYRV